MSWQILGVPAVAKRWARLAGLADLEKDIRNLIAVADADVGFCQSLSREIFAEGAGADLPVQYGLHGGVVLDGKAAHRFVRPAVMLAVGLFIAVQTNWAEAHRAVDRLFADGGAHRTAGWQCHFGG